MHPSDAIFARIESLWLDKAISQTPAFFSLASDRWDRTLVSDLEAFYCHIREASPRATAIFTSYSVGEKKMLVAHYESPIDTCHRVWTVGKGQTLVTLYSAPIATTGNGRSSDKTAAAA